MTSSDLSILSRHLASLTSLRCTVQLDDESRLYFGSTLRTLWLHLMGDEAKVPLINDAIVTVSQLPNLEDLTLTPPDCFPALSFAPLAAAARLRDLTLTAESLYLTPTRHQLDQIRMLPRLRKMEVKWLSNDGLASLLRLPHSLQWQQIHTVWEIEDATAAVLSTLPSLTTLETDHCRSLAFLPSLTRLRTLALRMDFNVRLAADIAAGLACCTELTELTLEAEHLSSQHLSQALSHLPLLRTLKVEECPALDSLSFLSECLSLARSLQSLALRSFRIPSLRSSELKHVLTLKCLTELSIHGFFGRPLEDCLLRMLTPPSLMLPKLQLFSCED